MSRTALPAVAALMVVAFVAASVFAYYPLQLTIQPTSPPVKFLTGNNAGKPDIGPGNTISVSIGSSGTSAYITIYPTYRTTYYKNVTLINNTDTTKAYRVWLVIDYKEGSLPSGSRVYLIVFNRGATRDLPPGWEEPGLPSGYVGYVELVATSTNSPQLIGTLSANSIWEVDFMVYIPEGTTPPASVTFKMHLVYTPSTETPP